MKKLIYFGSIFFLFSIPTLSKGQLQTNCEVEVSQIESTPAYLQDDWQNIKTIRIALVFVDFPDGRINGVDQPFFTYQLAQINDTDAAAEVGTKVINGDTVPVCSKYTYFDRWNMYFDSIGTYFATAHPDWDSHKDSAWGSFREYWTEASNGKLRIRPAIIRSSSTVDSRLNTGIINNFAELDSGRYVIKSIRLRKNKYQRPGNSNGYFTGYPYTTQQGSVYETIGTTALEVLDSLRANDPDEYPFDHRDFLSTGGKIIIVMAGGGNGIAGVSIPGTGVMVVRGRGNPLVNMQDLLNANINLLRSSRMDGISVSCHEMGHNLFYWNHTVASRYDVMGISGDFNCPSLPNPVYRMMQGWLQPIAIDSSQQLTNLPPIENSYQCGVITIYGNPSGAPDWSSGESYVIENRRMLGFDRKIVDTNFFNQNSQFGSFTGGLLVWHYSPYNINNFGIYATEFSIKLRTPNIIDSVLTFNTVGDVRHFFAFLPSQGTQYENFLQNRTYSGAGLQTGIELNNISQNNDNISLNINYTIAPPTEYDDVIFYRDFNQHFINDSGKVFYHSFDSAGFFNLKPGTVVEFPPGATQKIYFKGLEANGTVSSPITIQGIGYTSEKAILSGMNFNNLSSYSVIDSLILKHFIINNLSDGANIEFGKLYTEVNEIPIFLEDILFKEISQKITIQNSTLTKLDLLDKKLVLFDKINVYGGMTLDSSLLTIVRPKLVFDGSNSFLTVKNTSVSVASDTSLKGFLFKNSAYLNAHNTTFNSSSIWKGIVLENSGSDSIMNCTFSNAKTSVSIINDTGYSFINRIIKKNVFNVPAGLYNKGIYGEDNFRITIQENVFNMPANSSDTIIGLYLKNSRTVSTDILQEENDPAPSIRMFVIYNTFNNGTVSAMLMNYTSSYLPFYVKSNTFNSASSYGIIARNMTGSIKDNTISLTGDMIPMGIHLISSSPDFYNNYIGSNNVSLHTIGSSYPNLAPIVSGSNLSWTGGKNRLTSFISDNIQLVNSGNVYTNLGENRFLTDTNRYHIYGWVDTSVHYINAINNCWYPGSNARIYLRRNYTTDPIIVKIGVTSIDCDREIDPNGWVADYLGNGIYDSVKQSADTAGSDLAIEDQLYLQGQNYLNADLFIESISTFKDLIDTYNYYEDLPASVYDLYTAYENLDDSNQSHRNTLYGNLKDYLDSKIYTEGDYDASFIANAYDITIMCDANMLNYNNAANAYEFIALYHPDPDIRLNASWDYAEIEALMEGGYGGGERQLQITNDELRIEKLNELREIQEMNELNRINEIISSDPIMSRMKKIYEKISKDRAEKIDRTENVTPSLKAELYSKTNQKLNENGKENSLKSEQIEKQRIAESDKFKKEKARKNIFELKSLSKPELEKRRINDMLISAKDFRNTVSVEDQIINIPLDYKLNQNYPNPFNPVTNLEFQIPKSEFVTLKIYDMLGKEIATIVNDNLNPGTYRYEFNGSNFASGVYFYKLVSGDFIGVKKMVLIK